MLLAVWSLLDRCADRPLTLTDRYAVRALMLLER